MRTDLKVLRTRAHALQGGLGKLDSQIMLRLILGSMMTGPNGEPPLGDFSKVLKRFRSLLETIDEALAPPRGDRARGDRLRTIAYLCAIQYRAAAGKWPARRRGGVFHSLMNICRRDRRGVADRPVQHSQAGHRRGDRKRPSGTKPLPLTL